MLSKQAWSFIARGHLLWIIRDEASISRWRCRLRFGSRGQFLQLSRDFGLEAERGERIGTGPGAQRLSAGLSIDVLLRLSNGKIGEQWQLRLEGSSKGFARDEGMLHGLVRIPTLQRIQVQQAPDKISKAPTIQHLSFPVSCRQGRFHRIIQDDGGEGGGGKVFFGRWFGAASFEGKAFAAFEGKGATGWLSWEFVKVSQRVLAHFEHVVRGQAEALDDAADLVVIRAAREDWQAQEEFGSNAAN